MSLICGVNLSDRVYIASDTRVTHSVGDKEVYKDCICKNDALTADIVVAAAGSTKLASFLFTQLKKESFINGGITVVKANITDWAAKQIDNYLNSNPYSRACLIFAGLDRSKRKKIDGKKYIALVKEFQALRNVPLRMKDAVYKGITAKPNVQNLFF